MTKEELDKIIEIVSNIDSFEKILEACKICKDEQLIDNMQNALETGEEQVLIEAVEQLRDTIHSQIPSELQEYYYIQTIDRGAANILLDDEQRKKAEELYDQKIEEIISLDEDERIKASREIHMQESKLRVLRSLSDAKKLEVLDELDENTRYSVILEMTDDYALLEAFDKIGDELKPSIVEKIKSSEIKLQLLDKLEIGRLEILQTIDDPEVQLQALDKLSESEKAYFAIHTDKIDVKIKALEQLEEQDKAKVVKSISDPKQRFQMLDQLQGSSKLEVALSLEDPILMLQARDMFEDEEKGKITTAIKEIVISQKPEDSILRRLYDKNPDVLEKIDYRLLDKKYIDTLGEEIISVISRRKGSQVRILDLDDRRYEVFYKCIDNYLQSAGTEDWRPIAQTLLEHMKTGEYDEVIDSIEDMEQIDFGKLSIIMQSPNKYGIKTVEDIERYEKIVREKCDEIINTDGDIQGKKSAVFQKLFGQDLEYAKSMINQFGEDIGNIRDGDEKDFVLSLKAIMDLEDESVLREIYEECEEIGLVNGMAIERKLKTAYAEKFNEGLYQPKEENLIPQEELQEELRGQGLRVYDAGTDFKMILTSVSSFDYKREYSDYKGSWNRPVGSVEHCCTSYIRNDMIGTAGIRHFCYGFTRDETRWIKCFTLSGLYVGNGRKNGRF